MVCILRRKQLDQGAVEFDAVEMTVIRIPILLLSSGRKIDPLVYLIYFLDLTDSPVS